MSGWPAGCAAGRASSRRKLPPLGIMIETPGAALSADALALEADFFSIGDKMTLTAYTLAVDRVRERRRGAV